MATVAFTALLWTALAGVDGTAIDLQAGGRAQTSTRVFTRGQSAAEQVAMDFLPRISLLLDRKVLRLTLRYEPQLRVSRDFEGTGIGPRLAHGGAAAAEWDINRIWRTTASARGSVRLIDFAAPLGGEIPRLLDVRTPETVELQDLGMTLGLEGRPTPRLGVVSSIDADSSEGLGAAGRAVIPPMRKLRLAGRLTRDQSRKDVLRLEASAVAASFEGRGTASLATVTGGWARQAWRAVRFHVAAGASGARTESDPGRVIPEAETGVELTPPLLGGPLLVAAAIRSGAAVDRWTASIQDRLGVEADLGWTPVPRWTVRTTASWQTDRDRQNVSASRAELRAAWRASPRVTLSGGMWNERQQDPALAAGTLSYWGATIAADLLPNPRL